MSHSLENRMSCNPFKMDPQEFNQFIIDYACGNVHAKCMDHCLDGDTTEYDKWDAQREALIEVCSIAAKNAQAWVAHVNRFNTHIMPVRIRIMRQRAARGAEHVQL